MHRLLFAPLQSFTAFALISFALSGCAPASEPLSTAPSFSPEATPTKPVNGIATEACTPRFLEAFAKAMSALSDANFTKDEYQDFSTPHAICAEFLKNYPAVSCRGFNDQTHLEYRFDSATVARDCQALDERAERLSTLSRSNREPIESLANNLLLSIDDNESLNDTLALDEPGEPSDDGVSCRLRRDNPTGEPLKNSEAYRIRLAVQFPKGDSMAGYLWLDHNALVIECLKSGHDPLTALDVKKALRDQINITLMPDLL